MARLLNAFEPDASWATSLVNTFMGWGSTPTNPSPSYAKEASPARNSHDSDDLCRALNTLSMTETHPANRPHAPVANPPPPFHLPLMPFDYRYPATHVVPEDPPRANVMSQRLPLPIDPFGRTDFFRHEYLRRGNDPSVLRGNPSFNRRRHVYGRRVTVPAPDRRRPRARHVRRPSVRLSLSEGNIVGPPPAYSAIDPLDENLRLQDQSLEAYGWSAPERSRSKWRLWEWRKGRRERRADRATGLRGNVKAAHAVVGGKMDRGIRKVRNIPRSARRAQQQWHIQRAKKKLMWLRTNGFLSDQERMLTQELRG
jgi:hypothetical protein